MTTPSDQEKETEMDEWETDVLYRKGDKRPMKVIYHISVDKTDLVNDRRDRDLFYLHYKDAAVKNSPWVPLGMHRDLDRAQRAADADIGYTIREDNWHNVNQPMSPERTDVSE